MRRFLGPIVVVCALSVFGVAQPLIDKARAAGIPTVTTVDTARVGNTDSGVVRDSQAKGYGPVDQNAPLDFSTQPKGVPRNYVPGRLYNVQVDTRYTYAQLLVQMNYQAQALGVSCNYCHNLRNFAYDTPTKTIARTMLRMTNQVQHTWVDPIKAGYPNYAVNGAVGCVTCHRGAPRMDVKFNVVPVQYLDYPNKTTKQVGYVVNAMYSAARSLGQNCLFCHNSADFISLQYYPTNRIAHRMWQMVDRINHEYLPANVKAVTCYTCHQGAAWPSKLVAAGLDQTPVEGTPAHPEVHQNPGAHLDAGVAAR